MPNLQHLPLPRADYDLARKKKKAFGRLPDREYGRHGRTLSNQIDEFLNSFQARQRPAGIDPSLILRVQLDSGSTIDEQTWERCGLILLSIDQNKTLVLFSSDTALTEFKRRLLKYRAGPTRAKKKIAPYSSIFAFVDEIGEIRPQDRIGRLFLSEGIQNPNGLSDTTQYVVDIELWDFGTRRLNQIKVDELRSFIQRQGGRVSDQYIGESMILLRARATGELIKQILEIDYVATVDLPPKPALSVSELLQTGIEDLNDVPPPEDGAPGIAVLDSGLSAVTSTSCPRCWRSNQCSACVGRCLRCQWTRYYGSRISPLW